MEALVLIPLAIIGLFLWMLFSIVSLRSRMRTTEDRLADVRSRMTVLELERTRTPPMSVPGGAQSAVGTLVTRLLEPSVPGGQEPLVPVQPAPVPATPPALKLIGSSEMPPTPRVASQTARPDRLASEPILGLNGPVTEPPAAAWTRPVSEVFKSLGPINWEQFMGVKLFAWVGGFALFLAVAFFVKYSFDHGWISPELRVASGFLIGLALVVGGVYLHRRPQYTATAHSLCGTGVVILYAASFAAHGFYELIGETPAFVLMVLVTATAFLLAVRLPALVVAILGLVGGFLTPPLLSTGVDKPFGLFGYIALLDLGLVAVALKRRWHFLVVMAAVGTVLMQIGWAAKFFTAEKVWIALAIFAVFNALFVGAMLVAKRRECADDWFTGPAVALPFVTFAFSLWLLGDEGVSVRPGVLFAFLLVADLPLLVITLKAEARYAQTHVAAGAAAFLVLAAWTSGRLTAELLTWALSGYLLFAILHTVFPIIHARLCPNRVRVWLGQAFPPLALVLVMIPMLRELTVPWLVWPVVLLVNVLAVGLACLTGALLGVLAMVILTAAVTGVWLLTATAGVEVLPELLIVVGGFAVFFFFIGLGFGEKVLAKLEAAAGGSATGQTPAWLNPPGGPLDLRAQVPAVSAILPFLLLMMAVTRLPLANPTPVFGLALLLVVLLLVLVHKLELDALVPVALGCVLALEYVWHGTRFTTEAAGVTVAWNVGFAAVFTVFPFLFRAALADRVLPWVTSALAGPLHFFLVYRAVKLAWPNDAMGLIPAAFAIPAALALVVVARTWTVVSGNRLRLLAWFGGSALFFITLIFPTQFDRQWLTLGWALEGAALLWLFHRVPHPGLRVVSVALLVVAFARLALNPAVFEYHARSETRILNWYLYSYGVVTACLLAGARLLAPPRERLWRLNVPPVLYSLAAVLGFLLLNIEIADWFSTGASLTFQFNASFGQDMTCSIAWGLYAFLLLGIGFKTGACGARYAGMGLLVVTIVKLFLHDLWRLGGLYRIGSLIGLAVVLMVVSFIYQRFLSGSASGKPKDKPTPIPIAKAN